MKTYSPSHISMLQSEHYEEEATDLISRFLAVLTVAGIFALIVAILAIL